MELQNILTQLGNRFGVLAESNTHQLTVIARNTDVAVGDIFLLPCNRGHNRLYLFRTTQYANIMNRTIEINDVARNKLTMPDSYLAEDLRDEKLIELKGLVLGYSEWDGSKTQWTFHRPRRLPQHLSDVYKVGNDNLEMVSIMNKILAEELGNGGLSVGDLLAGESSIEGVKVSIPSYAFSHHIGIFGRTGCGKSNLMMVLLNSIMEFNKDVEAGSKEGPKVSILAIDPHDEFKTWHAQTGGTDGIRGIVNSYNPEEQHSLIDPFYYLTAKPIEGVPFERRLFLSRADVIPDDLISVMEFTEQQIAFSQQYYSRNGENWIGRLLLGDTEIAEEGETSGQYLPGTIAAVQRRIGCLRRGNTRIFNLFDPEMGFPYESLLPDIICALEKGRVITVDTTLMNEVEQFLLTTIVARVLFSLRKALKAAESVESLPAEIRKALGNDEENQQVGMRALADQLIERLNAADLPYIQGGNSITPLNQLPFVNVVIEEAPSILNPQRIKFGSVFRDISRQGRKFGIGLTVISQQVSEIDQGILTQINTEFNMALGNENERREAIKNASSDLLGFERELQVMAKGQVLLTASYKDVPIPLQVPEF